MWVGCYALDLYCDNATTGGPWPDEHGHSYGDFPVQYTDEHGSAARRRARLRGWILKQDGSALCPKCAARLKGER